MTFSLRRIRTLGVMSAALLLMFGARVSAQQTHVIVITGLGGEPRFSALFVEQGQQISRAAREHWGVQDSSLIWLAENSSADPLRIAGRSTRENVEDAFLRISRRVSPGDLIFVVLIGHGSGEGAGSKVNLPGVDPTAADYAGWISGFARQTVVFVNTASASGDFRDVLAGPGRLIVTSTRSSTERNESTFGGFFASGLATLEADTDKDGRISVMEAFSYAAREVERSYEVARKILTEHAAVSDSVLANRVVLGASRSAAVAGGGAAGDPNVARIVAERKSLEDAVAELREKKDSVPAAEYERELERLLLAIAAKNQELRAAGGTP